MFPETRRLLSPLVSCLPFCNSKPSIMSDLWANGRMKDPLAASLLFVWCASKLYRRHGFRGAPTIISLQDIQHAFGERNISPYYCNLTCKQFAFTPTSTKRSSPPTRPASIGWQTTRHMTAYLGWQTVTCMKVYLKCRTQASPSKKKA
jgi:hypothetical protein